MLLALKIENRYQQYFYLFLYLLLITIQDKSIKISLYWHDSTRRRRGKSFNSIDFIAIIIS